MARYWCEYYLFTYIQKLVSKSLLLYTVTTVRRLVLCPPKNYFVSFICKAKPLLIKFQLWRFKDCSTRRFRRNKKVKKVGRVGRRIQVCNWSNATGFVLTLVCQWNLRCAICLCTECYVMGPCEISWRRWHYILWTESDFNKTQTHE